VASFYWVGAEPGDSFECSVDEAGFVPCSPPYEVTSLIDSIHFFQVRQLDGSTEGELAERGFSVDVIGQPADITISDTGLGTFIPDGSSTRGATRKPLGSEFTWKWGLDGAGTSDIHNVVQNKRLFSSGDAVTTSDPFATAPSAGTYGYYCTVHGNAAGGGMAGTVEVIPVRDSDGEPDGLPFRVEWKNEADMNAKTFDVRYRVNGGKLKTWLNDTKKPGAVFGKRKRPTKVKPDALYEFQVRSQKGKRARSGFSPPLPVRP
jgi:hypothetical protein